MKIDLLVVENRDTISTEHCKMLTGIAWRKEVARITFWEGGRRPVYFMRQEMIQKFLETDCTHVLFIDSDVVLEEGFIAKLAAHNLPLVSGYYNDTNGFPINRKDGGQFLGKNLMEVDVFSMGLSLISREVLEKVPYPSPEPIIKPDADIEWCRDVKKAGYKIMQDFNIRGFHLLNNFF